MGVNRGLVSSNDGPAKKAAQDCILTIGDEAKDVRLWGKEFLRMVSWQEIPELLLKRKQIAVCETHGQITPVRDIIGPRALKLKNDFIFFVQLIQGFPLHRGVVRVIHLIKVVLCFGKSF